MLRHSINLPRLANLLDFFGLGFFYGAESEMMPEDTIMRWETLDMKSPIFTYPQDSCDGN